MKILLISYINSYKYGNTGLDYIAHFLRKSNNHVDIKYYHKKESYSEIIQSLPLNYDIYGFSVFETNYFLLKKISIYIKKSNFNAITIFGGQFVTMNYPYIIKDTVSIDYFILGDGESPLLRIINHHTQTSHLLHNDNNIATAKNFFNKTINIEDHTLLDADFDYYINDTYNHNINKTHCMMTKSNVCTGSCTFCCSKKGFIKYKDNEKIINEIQYLSINYGVRKFFFCDDDLFDIDYEPNRIRLNDLLDKIISLHLNIVFSGFSKVRPICNPLNYKILKKMNLAGFHHLFLGIDAGNNFDKKLYNKYATLEEGLSSIKILNNIGIAPRYGIIFINPYSSLETFRETYHYLLKLKSSNFYHYGGLHVQLLNGTHLLKKVSNDNLLDKDFSFIHTDKYHYLHSNIIPIVNFLDNKFMPKANSIKHQFNTLKRKYELVRHMNKNAEIYNSFISFYEQYEFENLKEFFYHLFEENDLVFCENNLDKFIKKMEINANIYAPIIEKLNNLFINTPIYK